MEKLPQVPATGPWGVEKAAEEGHRWLLGGKFYARWGHGRVQSSGVWGDYSDMQLVVSTGQIESLQGGKRVHMLTLKDIDRVEVQQGEPRRMYIMANATRRLEVLVASEHHPSRLPHTVLMCTLQAQRRSKGLSLFAVRVVPPLREAELTLVLVHLSPGPLGD